MVRKNTKVLQQANEIDEQIEKLKRKKQEMVERAKLNLGEYLFQKWEIGEELDKAYDAIDQLTPQANELINGKAQTDSSAEKFPTDRNEENKDTHNQEEN